MVQEGLLGAPTMPAAPGCRGSLWASPGGWRGQRRGHRRRRREEWKTTCPAWPQPATPRRSSASARVRQPRAVPALPAARCWAPRAAPGSAPQHFPAPAGERGELWRGCWGNCVLCVIVNSSLAADRVCAQSKTEVTRCRTAFLSGENVKKRPKCYLFCVDSRETDKECKVSAQWTAGSCGAGFAPLPGRYGSCRLSQRAPWIGKGKNFVP